MRKRSRYGAAGLFFQHQPNDEWDLDWAFERHVLPLPVGGTTRPVVVTGGKQAIFDVMEADTGKYVFSMDLGLQNVVTSIDPRTGGKVIDDRLVPGDGETKFVCPHAGGRSHGCHPRTTRARRSCTCRWSNPAWI